MRFSKKPDTQNFDDLPVDSVLYKSTTEAPTPIQLVQDPVKSKIGHKITLLGELSGTEDILIEGTLEGRINLEGYTVSIGTKGKVKSDIKAKSIIAQGSVNGDVEAQDIITLKNGSHVHGNIKSDRVELEDGANFSGGIEMTHTANSQIR